MRLFPLLGINTYGLPFFIEVEFNLFAFEADRTVFELTLSQNVGKFVQFKDFGCMVSLFFFDNLLCFLIAKTAIGIDDCTAEPLV